MYLLRFRLFLLLTALALAGCLPGPAPRQVAGTYCTNIQNLQLSIRQERDQIQFSLSTDQLEQGTGTLDGDLLSLSAPGRDGATFHAALTFADDGSFAGPFDLTGADGAIATQGVMRGTPGACPSYDLDALGVPQFVTADFVDLDQIERVSRYRSGFGHHYGDGSEPCRSMKHYYNPFANLRENNTVPVYSPVDGYIINLMDEGHGFSGGLINQQVHIRPDAQPAFTFVIFHVDLLSQAVAPGQPVRAGELLGWGRLYYPDLNEHATSLDIAVWVSTPAGPRVVSYFQTLTEAVFASYQARGASAREDFIIPRAERDLSPLVCEGERFQGPGALENWVPLK